MPRSFTFTTISDYLAAKATSGTGNVIYAELVSSGIKSGSCVSKITATGDVFVDSINPFVTPDLGQEGDTLYYSSTEGYRFLRAGNSAWDATSYGQVFIDLSKIPSGFSVVAPFSEMFTFKRTTEDIGSGKSSMSKIKGKSLVWNQALENGNFAFGRYSWASNGEHTLSMENNIATVTMASAPAASHRFRQTGIKAITGHKYLIKYKMNPSKNTITSVYWGGYWGDTFACVANTWNNIKFITLAAGEGAEFGIAYSRSSPHQLQSGDTVKFKDIVCFDLTLMFGAGNEPSTVAEFEALFNKPYYAYNAGQIINNKAKAIEFVGFNQVDTASKEESEQYIGHYYVYNDGSMAPLGTVNAFRVRAFPNTDYYLKKSNNTTLGDVSILRFEDVDNNFISVNTSLYTTTGGVITTPANCAYIVFAASTTAQYYVQLNLSGPRNGQYEPYKKVTLPIPITALRGKLNGQGNSVNIFPDGLKSAGNVYDEIGHGYAIKRVGTVDLGTLEWATTSTPGFFVATLLDIKAKAPGLVSSKYKWRVDGGWSAYSNGEVGAAQDGRIRVFDNSYNTPEELTAGVTGIKVVYTLATPEYYVLDRDFNWKYRTSQYHTKKMLPENGEEPTSAPFACEIKQI